jgi:hypothetical protein
LPTWKGDAERFVSSSAPASARSVAHRGADERLAQPQEKEVVAGREVPVLVEDAVVREEPLPVDRAHLAVRDREAGVVEIAVVVGRADEGDDPACLPRHLLERRGGRAHESWPEEQVLRRIARDRQLGEEDEVGAGGPGLGGAAEDPVAVAGEVADDGVDLGESEAHEVSASESKT